MTQAMILRMPKLGLTMDSGVLSSWLVAVGDHFESGQPVVVVETDKIASEVEAPGAGRMLRLLASAGDVLDVGAPIAEYEPADADAPGRIVATPLARRLARASGIDLRRVQGTGPGGRIKAGDLRIATPAATVHPPSAEPPAERVPVDGGGSAGAAQLAAARMVAAKRDIPHFYLASEVEISPLEAIRTQLREEGRSLSLTCFLIAAIVRALAADRTALRVWRGGAALQLDRIDLGIAIDTPQGLVAPVLRDLDDVDVRAIAARLADLAQRAREGRLEAADMAGSPMMTLSNAGMHDVTWMTSIIPPGQSAILGAGSVRSAFRPDAHGRPVLAREMGLVLSCDHRVFDGVSGLALLNRIRAALRRPLNLLLTSPKEG